MHENPDWNCIYFKENVCIFYLFTWSFEHESNYNKNLRVLAVQSWPSWRIAAIFRSCKIWTTRLTFWRSIVDGCIAEYVRGVLRRVLLRSESKTFLIFDHLAKICLSDSNASPLPFHYQQANVLSRHPYLKVYSKWINKKQ